MAQRSVASGTISFGLVSIPVKFFVACSADSVHFNQLTKDGNRVKQVLKDAVTGDEVSRSDLLKGYEYAKGQYVTFTPAEIKALEEADKGSIEIKEFVPAESVDLLHVEKSYYVGPGKGGDKPYNLLSKALRMQGKYAVAQWCNRGKQHLVIIRPYKDGIVVHQMYYADEVRAFDSNAAKVKASDVEVDMACKLIDTLSKDSYDPSQYKDEYKARVETAVEQKRDGKEVTVTSEAPAKNVDDLFAALQASLGASAA